MYSTLASHPLLKIINRALIDLPSPQNLSRWWNFGSLLGLCLVIQLLSGIFLALHYRARTLLAFERVGHIMRDVEGGWVLRIVHANGARFFFISLYLHVGRGLYYSSFIYHLTWTVGVMILILVIAAAFIGYVLPWGQMSFWGATVITNLFSAIPYLGPDIVEWIWGGFAVDNATLTRFFSFHFLIPFLVVAITAVHLLFLHQTGSRNPLGVNRDYIKSPFHPYFRTKDLFGFIVLGALLINLSLLHPWLLGDPENFIPANPLVTPVHIQPEWYFLFAYAILRSIPNKLGGVAALGLSIAILFIIPVQPITSFRGSQWYPLRKIRFWLLVVLVLLLTWIGARPVEDPYIFIGQLLTGLYFMYFLICQIIKLFWDSLLKYFNSLKKILICGVRDTLSLK